MASMASRRNRTRLLMAGAAAAASALAFYFAWKAFRADGSDPDEDSQDLGVPADEDDGVKELKDYESLMKASEEKVGNGIAQEESGFKVEEFENFIAEEYGEVSAGLLTEGEVSDKPGESKGDLKVSEITVGGFVVKEEDTHVCLASCPYGVESFSMGNGTGEDTQFATSSGAQFCSNGIEGMCSEGLASEFSGSRDVGFDELSMQDLSEEDGMSLGNAHEDSDSQNDHIAPAPEFEFDNRNGNIRDIRDMGIGLEGLVIGACEKSDNGHHHDFKFGDLEEPSDGLDKDLDSNGGGILGPPEELEADPSNLSCDSLEASSVTDNKHPADGIPADSVNSFKKEDCGNIECQGLVGSITEDSYSAGMGCNELAEQLLEGGISSSNRTIPGQSNGEKQVNVGEDPDGQSSNEVRHKNSFKYSENHTAGHECPKKVENIEGMDQSPAFEYHSAGDKDLDGSFSDLLEDVNKPDVEATQTPEVDGMDNTNHGLEDSNSDSLETQSSSSGGMDSDTLSRYVYQEAVNSSDVVTEGHVVSQTDTDLGEQINGQCDLLQTLDYANKSSTAGSLKSEERLSQLLGLAHMASGEFSEHQLEGLRTSKIESSLNGDFKKHSEGLDAYDAYLADPSVSPSMKSQVARAKAIAQKLYAAREGQLPDGTYSLS